MSLYLCLIIAFLLGGIPFGLIAGYLAGRGDIRKVGSGNIGATNVWRAAGAKYAIMVFIGDIGKGVAAVFLSHWLYMSSWPVTQVVAALLAGLAAVLGHTFSPYLRFRGGKGVNTTLGVFVSLMPIETLISLVVFFVMAFAFRFISLSSISATTAFAIILWFERLALTKDIDDLFLTIGTLTAILIMLTHRQNIKRLIHGTESRFQLKKVSE
jgi:glycerol-3-phosphate acyltransferase PlsY